MQAEKSAKQKWFDLWLRGFISNLTFINKGNEVTIEEEDTYEVDVVTVQYKDEELNNLILKVSYSYQI